MRYPSRVAATSSRFARHCFCLPMLFVMSCLASAAEPVPASSGSGPIEVQPERVIRVGVRNDSKPFSYLAPVDATEKILPGYRGYMVEICRRVLRDMVARGPFEGFSVRAIPVDAGDRFDELSEGRLEMLCGPDSITVSRLRNHNVSQPLFLSGMTYAYHDPNAPGSKFPRSKYCGHVVGVVRGTTAHTAGLRMLADRDLLLRFDPALEIYLTKSPGILRGIGEIKREVRAEGLTGGAFAEAVDERIGVMQKELAPLLKTHECPQGFTGGLPVRTFIDHEEGIDQLCKGQVLYYIGDYDVIRRKIEARGTCPVVLERFTSEREVYAAFFRLGFDEPSTGAVATDGIDDALLYAVFNHTLLSMMQPRIDILEYEFGREFVDLEKSRDLQAFFDSFKIAADQ